MSHGGSANGTGTDDEDMFADRFGQELLYVNALRCMIILRSAAYKSIGTCRNGAGLPRNKG